MLGLVSFLARRIVLFLLRELRFVYVVQILIVASLAFSIRWGWCRNLKNIFSINYFVIDSISLNLILLSLWCTILIVLASYYVFKKNLSPNLFIFSLLSLLMILILSFCIKTFVSFYVFFELRLVPTFFIIIKWGYQPERIQASLYILLYTICASLPFLLAILYIGSYGFRTKIIPFIKLASNRLVICWSKSFGLYFWGHRAMFFVLAFLVKTPIYFVHLWLPKAHVEAPVAGRMVLAAVLLKLGSYGLIRMSLVIPGLILGLSELVVGISLVGGVLTGMICIAQSDLKSLIAYSSIGHIGFLTAGVFSGRHAGIFGAIIIIIAHGLCSSGIFFLSNTFYQNSKSRSVILNKGVLFCFPFIVMFRFLIFSCNMSVPPSINLSSELILCMGVIKYCNMRAILIGLIVFLAGGYSMYLYVLSCHGAKTKHFSPWKELKDYDMLCISLHFIPLWGLILNLKIFICLSSLKKIWNCGFQDIL